MDLLQLIGFCLIIFVSCVFQGTVGFGFAFVAVPLALLFVSKEILIPAITIVSLVLNSFLILTIKQKINVKFIVRLLAFGVLGMPFGIMILHYATAWQLKLIAGIISTLSAYIVTYFPVKLAKSQMIDGFAGFIAGILTTSVNINGAPIAALFLGRGLPRDGFRKTLAIYFLCMSILSLPFFVTINSQLSDELKIMWPIIPFAIIGGWIGSIISHKIAQHAHKQIAVGVIGLTSVVSLVI